MDAPEIPRRPPVKKGLLVPLSVVAAALLLRLAYPPYSIHSAAFAAWALFFAALARSKRPLLTGFLFHAFFALLLCAFLFDTLLHHYKMGLAVSLAFLLLVVGALPSVCFALFSRLVHGELREMGGERPARREVAPVLFIAALFVVAEWARTTLSPEHGWGHLATVFYDTPEVLSLAPVFGGAGVSFLIIALSLLLRLALLRLGRRETSAALAFFLAGAAALALAMLHGRLRLARHFKSAEGEERLEVALVHPGIAQGRRWSEEYHEENLAKYRRLSLTAFGDSAKKGGLRLIVWPETSLTFNVDSKPEAREAIREIAAASDAWLLMWAPSFEGGGAARRFFNSAFLFDPGGAKRDRYDKNYLLPFAETAVGGIRVSSGRYNMPYSPGRGSRTLTLEPGDPGAPPLKIGAAICFEIGIASHVRMMVARGARLIANLSNDAWFGESSESLQQLSLLALRCAEFGVPGVRATGYGEAAVVDRFGRIAGRTDIRTPSVLRGAVTLPHFRAKTIQGRFPDWFVLLCGFYALVFRLRLDGAKDRSH